MFEQKSIPEALSAADSTQNGLSAAEAKARLEKNGPNALTEKKRKTKLQMFIAQLNEPMIYILLAAAVISAMLNEISDAIIILVVILVNAFIGVIQEGKAQKALDALKKLSSPTAMVLRDGKVFEIAAAELVVGDIVKLEAGRIVPADLRLTESINLKIDESALTGESVPSDKDAKFVAAGDLPLGDRNNMAYLSTPVAYGRGEGVVIATGMNTEIGKIAGMLNEAKDEITPLQARLADLGKLLGYVALAICAALFIIAVIQKRDIIEMLITAISLAVAAVPEGLPAVVTIVLAIGVQRMVSVNAIVRRLPAVETLGAVSVVCSDKTGTLTQNKMTVTSLYANGKTVHADKVSLTDSELLLKGMVLCNDASIDGGVRAGDPTELALLDIGAGCELYRGKLEQTCPRIDELAFDSTRKMMTTVHKIGSDIVSFTKGALDNMLPRCTQIVENGSVRELNEADKANILSAASAMAGKALRVLALAVTHAHSTAEEGMVFVGFVGMIDPPRPEAKDAVKIFKGASVKTVMITGDHRDTAFAIAKELGIADNESQCITGEQLAALSDDMLARQIENLRVFARVSPEHKVRIVAAFKGAGHIVSMTGDGVNDAPSLKAADIGVAMGITGTDVAKGAADIILTDDNFATIEKAIEEGRGIYANIQKTILFLLSSNFGEVITMFGAILVGLVSPLKAIHILWVNLITDSLPALALGMDGHSKHIMKEHPRSPTESLFAKGGFFTTLFYGTVIAACTLGAFLYTPISHLLSSGTGLSISALSNALKDPLTLMASQTYAFTVLGISQLFHALGMRDVTRSIFKKSTFNKAMAFAFITGYLLQILVTEVPFLEEVFGTKGLTIQEWLLLSAISTVPLIFHELLLPIQRNFRKKAKHHPV